MKSMIKIMIEIALGFIAFLFVWFILALFGYFAVGFIENIQFNGILVATILGILFVIVCWSIGADLLKTIKSRFKKCE